MRLQGLIGVSLLLSTACTSLPAPSPESVHTAIPSSESRSQVPSPTAITPGTATPDLSEKGTWLERASMPTARSEMPAVELNGLIYVPGGFGPEPAGLANGYGPVNTFDVYNPRTDEWQSLAPMPQPRHHLMVTAYQGKIYAFGGFIDPWITQSNTWVYDPVTDQWSVLRPMPAPRTAGAAVTLGDSIYLVGGTTSQAGAILPTWRYNPASDTWKDVAALSQPREHNAAVVLNGKIYALGGRWTTNYSSVEIYDPSSNHWTMGASMQFERAGFGATVMNGRIYVGGGELIDVLKTLNSVEVFDPETGTWSSLPDMPRRLHGVPLIGIGNTLYILGGSGRSADVINWGRVYALHP